MEDETLRPRKLPIRAGVGLKHRHYDKILQDLPDVGFFEVHAENYLGAGGKPLYVLEKIRENYPLSIHGVGLSIGSAQGLNESHLHRVAALVKRFEPAAFSEHLAWSTHDTAYYSDLLPVPYNRTVEDRICNNIDRVQNVLQRTMLLENPSNYLSLETSTLTESEMLTNVVKRTGCRLLLDVNNVYISAQNMRYSAEDFVASLPGSQIGELHLAGHATDCTDPTEPLLIDAHDRAVCKEVWSLYEFTLRHCGALPTLIEWDNNVPEWSDLLGDMAQADARLLKSVGSNAAVALQ
ncbi:MAG: DUF692 domain-containing protein [Granulosicoccus sp.]|nr:DUF692 domain-containing protein [Granulosicoccus sp.]